MAPCTHASSCSTSVRGRTGTLRTAGAAPLFVATLIPPLLLTGQSASSARGIRSPRGLPPDPSPVAGTCHAGAGERGHLRQEPAGRVEDRESQRGTGALPQ